jgi:hypothetical protein
VPEPEDWSWLPETIELTRQETAVMLETLRDLLAKEEITVERAQLTTLAITLAQAIRRSTE